MISFVLLVSSAHLRQGLRSGTTLWKTSNSPIGIDGATFRGPLSVRIRKQPDKYHTYSCVVHLWDNSNAVTVFLSGGLGPAIITTEVLPDRKLDAESDCYLRYHDDRLTCTLMVPSEGWFSGELRHDGKAVPTEIENVFGAESFKRRSRFLRLTN